MSSDRDLLVRITLASHKVAETFASKEKELSLKIKSLSSEALGCFLLGEEVLDKLKSLDSCFEAAEAKQLADKRNFLVLRREYAKIISALKPNNESEATFPGRKKRILDVLKNNGRVQLKDLAGLFPQVNRRTILRDIDVLLEKGVVERQGNGRGASYKLNGHKSENATLIRTSL